VLAPVEADEAVLPVDVQALIGGNDGGGVDLLDLVVAGAPLDALAVFFLEHLEPCDRAGGQVPEVAPGFLDTDLDLLHGLLGLEAVVGGDPLDADLGEADDILFGDLAAELLEEGL